MWNSKNQPITNDKTGLFGRVSLNLLDKGMPPNQGKPPKDAQTGIEFSKFSSLKTCHTLTPNYRL